MNTGHRRLLVFIACFALLCLTVLVTAYANVLPPAWAVHAVLAVGIAPLILAVILYFVPVLTRTVVPGWPVLLLPPAMAIAGTLAVFGLYRLWSVVYVAAAIGVALLAVMLGWMWRRARTALSAPHPCLAWYLAALGFLLLGLLCVLADSLWPGHWPLLRRLHLHINLLGFVGITAIGTLQVLLPTVGGYSDPAAGARLHRGLKYVIGGTLLLAAGLMWSPWLTWAGSVLWLVPVVQTAAVALRNWSRVNRGAGISLLGALAGFFVVLALGAIHAVSLPPSRTSIMLFFIAFLLPLVTGAVSHLLPVWLMPHADAARQERGRQILQAGSRVRTLVFILGGLLILLDVSWMHYPVAALAAVFLLQIVYLAAKLKSPGA